MAKGGKTGGRIKGVSVNKSNNDLLAYWDEIDFCPAKKITDMLASTNCLLTDKEIADTCLRLMKFKFAERKAVEVSAAPEVKESIEQIIQRLDKTK